MHEMTQRRGDHRFVFGLFTGTLVGAGLAMWLAPRASAKYQQASAHVGRTVADFTRRGRDVRDDIAGAVARGAHEVAHGALEVGDHAVTTKTVDRHIDTAHAGPLGDPQSTVLQPYDLLIPLPIGLPEATCREGVEQLNQLLADTVTLRDMYKKHHWQVQGPTFYELHLLFDKHAGEQTVCIDSIAERVQTLGGVSLAMGADIAETTLIARPPRGREEA